MEKKERRSDFAVDLPVKPVIIAKLGHAKSADHKIEECKQTSVGTLGRRRPTFEMKVSNYELEYEGQGALSGKRKHGYEWVMAVRNRRTGKTVFAPFETVRFKAKFHIPDEILYGTTKIDCSNYEEMHRNLIMEFGTKKARQTLNSSLRNAVDQKATEHLFAHAMNYMKSNEDVKQGSGSGEGQENGDAGTSGQATTVQVSTALPPCNFDAKTPAEIYKISDIVSDDVIDVLKPVAEQFLSLAPKEAEDEGHSPLVMAIIRMTASVTDVEERTTRVAYCLYLSQLIRVNHVVGGLTRFVDPEEFTAASAAPPTIVQHLMNTFTSVGGIGGNQKRGWRSTVKLALTQLHKDRLLAHVAVLLLILSGQHAFNIQKALQDLGMTAGKVTENKFISICKALGCRLERHQKSGGQICLLEKPPKRKNPLLGKRVFGRGRR